MLLSVDYFLLVKITEICIDIKIVNDSKKPRKKILGFFVEENNLFDF